AQPAMPLGARLRLGTLALRPVDDVGAIAFADGRTLASSIGSAGPVIFWDLDNGKELRRYLRGGLFAISPDRKWLALHLGGRAVSVVGVADGKERCVCKSSAKEQFRAATFSADRFTLYVGTSAGHIREFQTDTGEEVRCFPVQARGRVYRLWLTADE